MRLGQFDAATFDLHRGDTVAVTARSATRYREWRGKIIYISSRRIELQIELALAGGKDISRSFYFTTIGEIILLERKGN